MLDTSRTLRNQRIEAVAPTENKFVYYPKTALGNVIKKQ